MRLFKKLTAIPYLLVLVALLMPMANVSCDDDVVVAEPTLYKIAAGMDLEQELQEPALGILKKMQAGNPSAMQKFKQTMPNFPKMEPVPFLYAIFVGAILAQLGQLNSAMGIPLLKVEPGVGIHAASFMILIGTAMNLASIIRPIVEEFKARRAAKKTSSAQ